MKIAIGSDHAGFEYKEKLKQYLNEKGYELIDVGTYSNDSCDYPDFGHEVGYKVSNKEADFGVVICSTGEGIMMAANKEKGIRCGIPYNDKVAALMRKHNDCNVVSFGANFMSFDTIVRRLEIILRTKPEFGRHERRRNKIN